MNILKFGTVKARKNHRCELCDNIIPRGAQYQFQSIKDEGSIYNWRECLDCYKIVSENMDFFKINNYEYEINKDAFDELIQDLELRKKEEAAIW
jgi:hypothetical protein